MDPYSLNVGFNLKAILVQRRVRNELNYLDELEALAETAGYEVVGRMEQVRSEDLSSQIGPGKVEELDALVRESEAQRVIFDNELRPTQVFNLQKALNVMIIDRFQLVLEIFARRAGTLEAKYQIELARLKYGLPRLREEIRLSTVGEQAGFRGSGEIEIAEQRRTVQMRISSLKQKLADIQKQRRGHRTYRKHSGFLTVSLAGYTNAGKSTLFNKLVGESVPVDDQLFTTLSTTMRAMRLNGYKALLSDTVGFIDKLPHLLVEAFYSTLEEALASDALVLLVDANESWFHIRRKVETSLRVLGEVGAATLPIIVALNKVDRVSGEEAAKRVKLLEEFGYPVIPISALQGKNLESLKGKLLELLPKPQSVRISLPNTDASQRLISWIYANAQIDSSKYQDSVVKLDAKIHPAQTPIIRSRVRALNGYVKNS
jgi:GTP-binding protein HflX